MTTQILVPLHTFPDGNSTNIARHVARVAQHLQGSVHALFLNADFPPVGNPLANLILDTAALVENARSRSRQNGKALLRAMQTDIEQQGIGMVCTHVDYYPTELSDTVSDVARYHDLTILASAVTMPPFAAPPRRSSSPPVGRSFSSPKTWSPVPTTMSPLPGTAAASPLGLSPTHGRSSSGPRR